MAFGALWKCSSLILVCPFCVCSGLRAWSWIWWENKATSWHWAVRAMPSNLLLRHFQAGWTIQSKKSKEELCKLSNRDHVQHSEWWFIWKSRWKFKKKKLSESDCKSVNKNHSSQHVQCEWSLSGWPLTRGLLISVPGCSVCGSIQHDTQKIPPKTAASRMKNTANQPVQPAP